MSDCHSSSSKQGSHPLQSSAAAAQSDAESSPQDNIKQPQPLASDSLHFRAESAVGSRSAQANDLAVGVLQPDGTGLSPLDDALLQLVLQTLSESSLEQVQQHQQRQQQEQQAQQQEAIERQVSLQMLAQLSLQQMQNQAGQKEVQEKDAIERQLALRMLAQETLPQMRSPDVQEPAQQQNEQQAADMHEAMLQALAETALAGLSQEQQQQQEQQKLLQQQQEVYEQQQQLLQHQSAVHDALLQQQQWEQAQQQQQVFAQQQQLIKQQQAMLQAMQQQQQESLAHISHHTGQLEPQSMPISGSDASADEEASNFAVQQDDNAGRVQQAGASSASQAAAQDPPSPPALRLQHQQKPAAEAAAAADAEGPAVAYTLDGDTAQYNTPELVEVTVPASELSNTLLMPPAALLHLPTASPHEQSSAAVHPQSQVPTVTLSAAPAAAPAAPLASTPEAYYLIPASAFDAGLGTFPKTRPVALPRQTHKLPPAPLEAPAAVHAQLSKPDQTPISVQMPKQQPEQSCGPDGIMHVTHGSDAWAVSGVLPQSRLDLSSGLHEGELSLAQVPEKSIRMFLCQAVFSQHSYLLPLDICPSQQPSIFCTTSCVHVCLKSKSADAQLHLVLLLAYAISLVD